MYKLFFEILLLYYIFFVLYNTDQIPLYFKYKVWYSVRCIHVIGSGVGEGTIFPSARGRQRLGTISAKVRDAFFTLKMEAFFGPGETGLGQRFLGVLCKHDVWFFQFYWHFEILNWKNLLKIKLFCFSSNFDATWWSCSTHCVLQFHQFSLK